MQSFDRDIGRAQTTFVSSHKDLEALIRALPSEIQEDLDKMNAKISSLSKFRVTNKSKNKGTVVPFVKPMPTEVTPSSCDWVYSDWRLEGKYIGGCGGGDFSYDLTQIYEGLLLEAEASQGTSHYLKIWELGPDGKRLEPALALNDFTVTKKAKRMKRWHLAAIHIDLGVGVEASSAKELIVSPHLGVSFLGYGKTRDDLDWRSLKVFASFDEETLGFGVCPISYNLGKDLPLLSNIWLSPCYLYKEKGVFSVQVSGVL
jgi:hypothetical protein